MKTILYGIFRLKYYFIFWLIIIQFRFETTRQTLLQDHTSMLAKMFDPNSHISPAAMKVGVIYFV